MTIFVPPELRESQISYVIRGLDQFYANKTITYAQLEEALARMSDDDLQSALVYSANDDVKGIVTAVLDQRGADGAAPAPTPASPMKQPTPEVLF